MSEKCMDTLRCSPSDLRQAMSIHTQKITDACRDQDCIEDLRVYLTEGSQILLDTARNVRVRCAQLLHSCIQVEPMAFDRNRYCVEVTFFYRIEADALVEPAQMVTLVGLAVFSKRHQGRSGLSGIPGNRRCFCPHRIHYRSHHFGAQSPCYHARQLPY